MEGKLNKLCVACGHLEGLGFFFPCTHNLNLNNSGSYCQYVSYCKSTGVVGEGDADITPWPFPWHQFDPVIGCLNALATSRSVVLNLLNAVTL